MLDAQRLSFRSNIFTSLTFNSLTERAIFFSLISSATGCELSTISDESLATINSTWAIAPPTVSDLFSSMVGAVTELS